MFFLYKYKTGLLQKRKVPTIVGISLPGRPVAVNSTLNFTFKTSHPVASKKNMELSYAFPGTQKKTQKQGDFNEISQGSRPFCLKNPSPEQESGPVVRRSTHSSARRAIPGASWWFDEMFGKNPQPLRELQEPQSHGGLESRWWFSCSKEVIFRFQSLVFQGVIAWIKVETTQLVEARLFLPPKSCYGRVGKPEVFNGKHIKTLIESAIHI